MKSSSSPIQKSYRFLGISLSLVAILPLSSLFAAAPTGIPYSGATPGGAFSLYFANMTTPCTDPSDSVIGFETTPGLNYGYRKCGKIDSYWKSNDAGVNVFFTGAGNVGIGTNSPTSKLDIAGNIKTNAFTFDGNDDGWLRLRNGDGGAYKDFAVNQLWTYDQVTASGWLNSINGGVNVKDWLYSSNGGVNVNYVNVRPQNNVNEGGEIALVNSNPESGRSGSIIIDNFDQWLRLFRWRNSPGEYTEYANFRPDRTVLGMQGNVGIGTNTPTTKLDVRGVSAGNFGTTTSCCTSNFTLGISEATSSNGRLPSIQFHAAGFQEGFLRLVSTDRTFEIGDNHGAGANLALRNPDNTGRNVFLAANGSSYFNAGNVGIGTTSPSYKLHVAGDILANGWLRTTGNSGWYSETYGWGWYMSDASWIRGYSDKSLWMSNGHIATNGSLSIGYDGATTTARSAIIAGNVGIGTTSPATKLDVNGNIRFNDTLSTPGRMHITGGEYLYMLNTNGAIVSKAWGGNGNMNIEGDSITQGDMYAYGATNKWIFHTPDDGRTMMYIMPQVGASWAWGNSMRLANNGNVGIGGIDPTVKLDVNGEIKSNAKITTPELCLNGNCKASWPSGGNSPGWSTVTICSAGWGTSPWYGTACANPSWFPDWFDQTFRYIPSSMGITVAEPFDANNPDMGTAYFWKPMSIPSRVEVRVTARQDNHWPAVGTIYRFGPGQTYAYNTQNEVHHWSGGGQNTWLWLTVNTDGTIRYRANDADFGNGWVALDVMAVY